MAIFRTKRIDLQEYDQNWKDSFILVSISNSSDLIEMQREVKKLLREDSSLNLELKNGVSVERMNEVEDRSAEIETELSHKMRDFIKKRFISGSIYDNELKAERAMTPEDFDEFDLEIIRAVMDVLRGNVPKV